MHLLHRSAVLGAQAVWLVGGERADAEELVAQVPAALGAHPVLIPQEPFAAAYSALMNVSDGSPSTGFAGACPWAFTGVLRVV